MLEELLPYYEQELGYLRELSSEFAHRYPKIAGRLQLSDEVCEDPHVERLIQSFALLSSRIHKKLDDELPEMTEAFLQVLYPHYLRPVPSMSVIQYLLDEKQPGIQNVHTVPRHTLVRTVPVDGVTCQFRTAYDVALWPVRVADARLQIQPGNLARGGKPSAGELTLSLEALPGSRWETLAPAQLRFYLDLEPALAGLLYERLLARVDHLRIEDSQGRVLGTLPASALSAVGFADEEALLENDARSFSGYRLLTEYFALPEKYQFIDLSGLAGLNRSGVGNQLHCRIIFNQLGDDERHQRLAQRLDASVFRLGCTPVVNLFRQAGEPIRLTHRQTHYPVVADARRPHGLEVYAIHAVRKVEKRGSREVVREVMPFYSLRHASPGQRAYWQMSRRPALRADMAGTEVELTLVDMDEQGVPADSEVLSLDLTCTNRDLPRLLPFGGNQSPFVVESGQVIKGIRCLKKPTASLTPPARRGRQWRLVSHLLLNPSSLLQGGGAALQEILTLYNFQDDAASQRQIEGVLALAAQPGTTRMPGPHFPAFVRGLDVTLQLDAEKFIGSGPYLFASIIEHYLGLACAPNSFVRLHVQLAANPARDEWLWPARCGEGLLL